MTLQEKKEQFYNFVNDINFTGAKNIPTVEIIEKEQEPHRIFFDIKYLNKSQEVYNRLLLYCSKNNILVLNTDISYLDGESVSSVELYFIDTENI